nr:translation initiation factor IF-2-like [Equus asinus]
MGTKAPNSVQEAPPLSAPSSPSGSTGAGTCQLGLCSRRALRPSQSSPPSAGKGLCDDITAETRGLPAPGPGTPERRLTASRIWALGLGSRDAGWGLALKGGSDGDSACCLPRGGSEMPRAPRLSVGAAAVGTPELGHSDGTLRGAGRAGQAPAAAAPVCQAKEGGTRTLVPWDKRLECKKAGGITEGRGEKQEGTLGEWGQCASEPEPRPGRSGEAAQPGEVLRRPTPPQAPGSPPAPSRRGIHCSSGGIGEVLG